jgi:hypothetical protein
MNILLLYYMKTFVFSCCFLMSRIFTTKNVWNWQRGDPRYYMGNRLLEQRLDVLRHDETSISFQLRQQAIRQDEGKTLTSFNSLYSPVASPFNFSASPLAELNKLFPFASA